MVTLGDFTVRCLKQPTISRKIINTFYETHHFIMIIMTIMVSTLQAYHFNQDQS